MQYDLRNAMHDHLQSMDFDNLDRMPTGQLVARANSDSTLVQGLLSFFPIMSGNVLLMLLSLGVMFYLSPLLAHREPHRRPGPARRLLPDALAGLPGHLGRPAARGRRRPDRRRGRQRRAGGQGVRPGASASSSGSPSASQTLYGSQMRAVRLQSRYQPLLEAIPALGQVAILAFGGWLALHHEITLGTFLAFSTYVAQLVAPARQLAGVLTIGQQARAGVERIFQLLDLEPAIADAPDAVELPELRGEIDFSDVHFAYGDGTPVLQGFDLHIAAGERVALVGPSGSGKSTVAMLVSRFYDPDAGSGPRRRPRRARRDAALAAPPGRRGVRGELPLLRLGAGQHRLRATRRHRRRGRGGGPGGRRPTSSSSELPRGYDTVVGRAGADPVGRPAPAHRPGPGHPVRPAHPDPRRRHQRHRRQDRGGHPRRACAT